MCAEGNKKRLSDLACLIILLTFVEPVIESGGKS